MQLCLLAKLLKTGPYGEGKFSWSGHILSQVFRCIHFKRNDEIDHRKTVISEPIIDPEFTKFLVTLNTEKRYVITAHF